MDYSRLIVIVIRLLFITSEALAAAGVFVYPGKGQTRISRNRTSSVATNGRKSKPDLIRTNRCSKRLLPPQGGAAGARREAPPSVQSGAPSAAMQERAAIGAGVGAAGGAARRRQAEQQHAAAQQKAKQEYNAEVAGYKRAFSACMTGRGYTVS